MSCKDAVCNCADMKYDYSLVVPEIRVLLRRADELLGKVKLFREGKEWKEGKKGDEGVKGLEGGKDVEGEEGVGDVTGAQIGGEEIKEGEEGKEGEESKPTASNKEKNEQNDYLQSKLTEEHDKLKILMEKIKMMKRKIIAAEATGSEQALREIVAEVSALKVETDSDKHDLGSLVSLVQAMLQTNISKTSQTATTEEKDSTTPNTEKKPTTTTSPSSPSSPNRYPSHPLTASASFRRANPLATYTTPLSTTNKILAHHSIAEMADIIALTKLHSELLADSLSLRVKVAPMDKETLKLLDGVGEGLSLIRDQLVDVGVEFPIPGWWRE